MRVMTVLGSPRRRGNTAAVLTWVEEELMSLGHEVDRVDITDHDVRGCIGCYACKESLETPCIQQDDANALFARVIEADALVLSSPLYCWGLSAQLKAFVDRAICLVMGFEGPGHESRIADKRLALVATAEGPRVDNLDLLEKPFAMMCDYTMTLTAGALLVPGCPGPDALGDEVREQARALARAIVA